MQAVMEFPITFIARDNRTGDEVYYKFINADNGLMVDVKNKIVKEVFTNDFKALLNDEKILRVSCYLEDFMKAYKYTLLTFKYINDGKD